MQQNRQFVRLKTRQQARLRLAGDGFVACEIRNFCPTGFFLRLLGQDPANILGPSLIQATVAVEFTGSPESGGQTYTVEGRVVHYAETGLGILAKSLPAPAFQALLDYRVGLYQAAGESRPDDLDPVDARTIRLQCLSLYRPFLARVAQEFFRLANEHGAEEYRSDIGLTKQSLYLSGLAEIKLNQGRIQQQFVREAIGKVEQAAPPGTTAAAAAEVAELSLVEEDEFEDWLNLAATINKLEVGLQRQLGYFERLYLRLADKSPEQDDDAAFYHGSLGQYSPFSPDALCRSFQLPLAGLNLTNAQRALFYRLFGQAVDIHGPAFYDSLGKVVAVAERRQSRARRRRASDQAYTEAAGGYHQAPPAGPFSTEAPAPETMGYSLDRTLSALNEFGLGLPIPAGRAEAPGGTHPGGSVA
jgi:hypothetical protein